MSTVLSSIVEMYNDEKYYIFNVIFKHFFLIALAILLTYMMASF